MAQDIEEFLRMAAARKKQQRQAAQAPQQQPPQRQDPPKRQQPASNPRPLPSQSPARRSEPDVYIVDEGDMVEDIRSLQPTIRTTVSTDDIVEHTSHLGEDVFSRHDIVEDRVNKKFDHGLGRLEKEDISDPAVVDHGTGREEVSKVGLVFEMLKSPGSLRQAIILKEVFDRPDF